MKSIRLTQAELEALIARYFDAVTTEEEEDTLRHALATGKYQSTPPVKGALAALSLASVGRRQKRIRQNRIALVGRVAAILVVAAVGAAWLMNSDRQKVCETYIAGTKIEDKKMVMSMISNDLACMTEASEDFAPQIEEQFDDISKLLED